MFYRDSAVSRLFVPSAFYFPFLGVYIYLVDLLLFRLLILQLCNRSTLQFRQVSLFIKFFNCATDQLCNFDRL
jgi:hypothetical protein